MKKLISVVTVLLVVILFNTQTAKAESYDDIKDFSNADSIMDNLPDDVKDNLSSIGLNSIDYTDINNLTFNDIYRNFSYFISTKLNTIKNTCLSYCSYAFIFLAVQP
jgi:hypothetical protein